MITPINKEDVGFVPVVSAGEVTVGEVLKHYNYGPVIVTSVSSSGWIHFEYEGIMCNEARERRMFGNADPVLTDDTWSVGPNKAVFTKFFALRQIKVT